MLTIVLTGKTALAKLDMLVDHIIEMPKTDAIGFKSVISGYSLDVSHFEIVLSDTFSFSANCACVK